MEYLLETLDTRFGWHKTKVIKNIIGLEITWKHYIFTTIKNKKIKLRTDTWKVPLLM